MMDKADRLEIIKQYKSDINKVINVSKKYKFHIDNMFMKSDRVVLCMKRLSTLQSNKRSGRWDVIYITYGPVDYSSSNENILEVHVERQLVNAYANSYRNSSPISKWTSDNKNWKQVFGKLDRIDHISRKLHENEKGSKLIDLMPKGEQKTIKR